MTAEQTRLYRDFVRQHRQLPVFYQDWWLTAACGEDNWSAAIAKDKDGRLAGIWPYCKQKRFAGLLNTVTKPVLTPFCGAWISPPPAKLKPAKVLSRNDYLLHNLAAQLPAAQLISTTSPYDFDAALPLQKLGWKVNRHYSYRLRSEQHTPAKLWNNLDGKVRTALRKLEGIDGRIKRLIDPQIAVILQQKVYGSQSSKVQFAAATFLRLFAIANKNQQAIGWTFNDKAGIPVASVWLPFDDHSAYLLIAASDPEKRHEEDAVSHLIWHAVQWCCERNLIFDFEGSYLPGVEEFYRSWGPEVKGYLELRKTSVPLLSRFI